MTIPCDTPLQRGGVLMQPKKKSATLVKRVSRSGKGLFSGVSATITFCPSEAGSGVSFQRTDLPGAPILRASFNNVKSTPRCTILGSDEVTVQTVEHVLAALAAYGIDNILIQIDGPEVPIFDGSSIEFVSMIEEAGVAQFDSDAPWFSIEKPVYWSQGDIHIVAIPSNEYRISYTLSYPQSELIKSQFYSFLVSPEAFKNEIASSRTFSLYEEIMPYIEKGYLKGGSLENAVIIKDHKVMNPDGLRHPDEMVRHKILDMLGDLFLLGFNLQVHIIAIRSGHYANNAFAKELFNQVKTENC